MEISTTAATIPATVKTPETESEARARIQPTKPLSSTNGVLKRHQPLHHYHPYTNNHIPVVVIYKDCLKNHAASLGGHAVDGCGEFMPSSSSNPTDPTSLKCAACGCHRNFHRREPEEPLPLPLPLPPPNTTTALEYKPLHRHHPPPPASLPRGGSTPNSPSPPPISSSYYPSAPHMLLALSASVPGHPADTPTAAQTTPAAAIANSNGSRKRFRTKFTQNQKERMFEFAERVGWKIQKRDEELISEFCGAVGVDKGVLKVWMHNNKNTSGKKDNSNNNIDGSSIGTIGLIDGKTSIIDPITSTDYHHHQDHNDDAATATTCEIFGHQHHNNDSVSPPAVAANGSSSSS